MENRPAAESNPEPASSAIQRVEIQDLEERLAVVRRKRRRHLVWALFGLSPAAMIPLVGLVLQDKLELVFVLVAMVTVSQFYSWAKAGREEENLREGLRRLRVGN